MIPDYANRTMNMACNRVGKLQKAMSSYNASDNSATTSSNVEPPQIIFHQKTNFIRMGHSTSEVVNGAMDHTTNSFQSSLSSTLRKDTSTGTGHRAKRTTFAIWCRCQPREPLLPVVNWSHRTQKRLNPGNKKRFTESSQAEHASRLTLTSAVSDQQEDHSSPLGHLFAVPILSAWSSMTNFAYRRNFCWPN